MKQLTLAVLGLLSTSLFAAPASAFEFSSDGTYGTSVLSAYSHLGWKEEVPVVQTEAAAFIVSQGRATLGATLHKYVAEGRRAYPQLSDLQITALILASTVSN